MFNSLVRRKSSATTQPAVSSPAQADEAVLKAEENKATGLPDTGIDQVTADPKSPIQGGLEPAAIAANSDGADVGDREGEATAIDITLALPPDPEAMEETTRSNQSQLLDGSAGKPSDVPTLPKPTTIEARVLARLSHEVGVTISELCTETGWLPHSLRAVLSRLRTKGHHIEKIAVDKGGTVYRIGDVGPAGGTVSNLAEPH